MIYRNPKILALAKECPVCMDCGKRNDGTLVAAHSNQSRDGKGMGIKAHDYRVAFICHDCHAEIDQGNKFTKAERVAAWEAAHRKTIGWLFEAGYLEVRK